MAQEKTCPRCGNTLVCRAEEVAACACSQITLSAEQLQAIGARWKECLCPACLRELQQLEVEEIHGGT